ncbi:bifunctional 5,10-methylenetetrahydrofolate dehydrogenase/5,10-methenyltetrahydrofolate cyclohydrolase [Mesoplasma syrphidae]|uniref:Bifunctional protein FolD n=1 Tax=Mesoplasma syrphidae TaxID=225999 RepID=A0A2K9BS22_9MOLU|nr:bifunctional 5,10-methylenetetrahydrofolate dehydrogenase/5,10-methenyltetrahydrofolate cyclohydrolase [Mesoplasma syrphidae]AUF83802.1 bifunctional 5,10-methylenetetrahydrofolate dehydrogenase/5,10-methenyltetrahydrofolate cyclohydrolase [Mesoplasma syrphidae]
MKILDGKAVALKRRQQLAQLISREVSAGNRRPTLAVILVGNDEASQVYVKHKTQIAQAVGIEPLTIHLDKNVSHEQLYGTIDKLNLDKNIDGILLQLPLPKRFVEEDYLQAIEPNKDVDGFHYIHQGKMLQGYDSIYPCTPLGVINLLAEYQISVHKKNVVMVGTSNIVGKPLAVMLLNLGATVTMCNQNTQDIKMHTKAADILISATGKQFIITKDMVKPQATVIDIGITRDLKTNKLVGDVDYINVAPITSAITPVPGGVGPMTVITLMENTFKLYQKHLNL